MDIPPFLVGDIIVAIKDHSQKHFVKHSKVEVIGVKKSQCKCNRWLVHISSSSPFIKKTKCMKCGDIASEGIWYAATSFRKFGEQKIKHVTFTQEEKVCMN